MDEIVAFEPSASQNTWKSYDFSYFQLDSPTLEANLQRLEDQDSPAEETAHVQALCLHHNVLTYIPNIISSYTNLRVLDVSNNELSAIDDLVVRLTNLKTLIAKHNRLDNNSLPKDFGLMQRLEELNLSGNALTTIPPQILELTNLKALHLGSNQIDVLSRDVHRLKKLEILYLGGNNLAELPNEMGQLSNLQALILCENKLQNLPSSISNLRKLRSLALHKNQLSTLPPAIVRLQGLIELSLRDNPLVVRFVRTLTYNPPKLMELAAKCVKAKNIPYGEGDLPRNVIAYLTSAQRCVNPKCKGVYFDSCFEHVKFVDFCGKYRIPLLQYLCSPKCSAQPAIPRYSHSDSDTSEDEFEVPASKLKQVLLG